jgi:hypothetical protein
MKTIRYRLKSSSVSEPYVNKAGRSERFSLFEKIVGRFIQECFVISFRFFYISVWLVMDKFVPKSAKSALNDLNKYWTSRNKCEFCNRKNGSRRILHWRILGQRILRFDFFSDGFFARNILRRIILRLG